MAKTTTSCFGIEMTTLEEMYFSAWLTNKSGIAMNTLYPEERKKVVVDWLNEHRNKIK